jgi:hypothetical protein
MRTWLALGLCLCAVSAAAVARSPAPRDPGRTAQDTLQAATAPALDVAEIAIATAITDRQPQNPDTSFPADVGTLYCWTRIVGAEGETRIEHVWVHEDQEMGRVPLRVASPNWRTWSSKQIAPEWTGNWRCDVVGPDGTVLKSAAFTVGAAGM